MGKRGEFGEYKRNGGRVQEKGKYRSKIIREVRYSRRKEL